MGVIATAVQYTTLIMLVELSGLSPVVSSSCGFILGAVVNYWCNRRYTFQSTKAHHKAFSQFAIVASIGFGLNAFFMFIGTHYTTLPYLLVQVFATLLVLFWNFLANRHWTFRRT